MLLPRQLFVSTLALFLLSCNNTDKQKEQSNSVNYTKEPVAMVPKQDQIKPELSRILKKPALNAAIKKTHRGFIGHSNPQIQTTLENDFKTLEQSFQHFIINSNADTTLNCKEGSVFKIKHSSFVIASDLTEVKGDITFQVKEFYKISDILSARLSTHANDNILETGGMLFIQATADGQLCKLKDNSTIEVSFPFTEKKENMLLFAGSWINQKINWELFPAKATNQKSNTDEIAAFPGGPIALKNYMLRNLVYPDSLSDLGIGGIVHINFIIDEKGKATDVTFKNPSQKGFRKAILNTLAKMPVWKPANRNGIPVKSVYSQSITFDNGEQGISDTTFKKYFEATTNDHNINKLGTSDIQQYVFSASKLGWINCDRFYNSPKPRIDFYVDCGEYTELDIKLVFHSFKAVLGNFSPATTFKFPNLPVDEDLTVVVVKKINNDTYISITESNTSRISINNLLFEKVTMDKLKQKLDQLNHLK